MDNNGKSRHSVWLSDEVWQEVDAFYKLDNCPTRNEFVEKALRQYCGRLHAERSVAYLPRALQEMLEGTLGVFGDRLGKLLFKLVVEHNMTNHLLGGDIDMTRDEYNKMRGSSVREVASTHGSISSYYKVVVIKFPLQGQNATIDKVLWIGLNLLPQDGFRKAPTMALCF